jgi:two-component SAPR family response regulator
LAAKTKIGIVEDEGIIAMDIKRSLYKMGFEVIFSADEGEKAINKLNNCKPDLIIMDIVLKGKLNGLETAGIIKRKFSIPIIFLSAFEDEDKLKDTQLNSYNYVVKPYEEDELKEVIEKTLCTTLKP